METWKPIQNHNNYFISDLGRVRSLKKKRDIILKSSPRGKSGYLAVTLWSDNGIKKSYHIHTLVAEAFLNHISSGHKVTVDHLDNDKLNNRLKNLQLLSNRANVSKNTRMGTSKYIGVHWSKSMNRWKACIEIEGVKNILGYFNDEIDASIAYQSKLKTL